MNSSTYTSLNICGETYMPQRLGRILPAGKAWPCAVGTSRG